MQRASVRSIGKTFAPRYLIENRFVLKDDREANSTNPYADVVAKRDDVVYAFSIITRNKYEAGTKNVNTRYKLSKRCMQLTEYTAEHQNATPARIAIQIDGELVSVFFVALEMLKGNRGIPMTDNPKDAVEKYKYECLAKKERHECEIDQS